MALTTAQQLILKNYINSIPAWAALPNNSDSAFFIADELAKVATPAFIVWRSDVRLDEILVDGFDFAQVDNLTNGQARIWEWLFDSNDKMNASIAGVRTGIAECWKGTAAKVAVGNFVLSKCKRSALVIEKLLAVGAGTDAVPATMGYEGRLSYQDVEQARSI